MEQKTLTHLSAIHIKRLPNTTSESVRALAFLAMKTWDNILIYVISNKIDPESKQLWAQRIASVKEPTYEMLIAFLEKRQFESENVSQRIYKSHTQPH
jgi:hypothetical protein